MKTIKDKYLLVGADTAGFPIKEAVVAHLKAQGWTIEDIGVTDYERDKDDLNLMFHRVGLRVGAKIASGEYERAMVFCGTGMGILSDSDSLVLRPEFSTLAQARTRVSIYGLSGLPVTVGDTIASLDAPRIDLLRRIMPVVPVTPASLARAEIQTDCLVESVAEFARPWGTWEVRAFSNLDTNEARRVSFSASGRAVWDFWRDEQLRLDGDGAIKLEVPPCDTRVVRLTPFSAQGATLLSVPRHITQGGYELASFRSDAHEVSGAVKCPGGETVKVTLLLPGSRGAITSSHPCKLEGDVLRLELSPVSSETVEWHVAF